MRLVALALLAGCLDIGQETPCDPGPYFRGPMLENPGVASAGDRFLVQWRTYPTDEPQLDTYRGVMLEAAGAVLTETRFDFSDDMTVRQLVSGPDRILVFGEGTPTTTPVEIRLASGALQSRFDVGQGGGGVFDGESFLVGAPDSALRVGLDGTVSAPFALPSSPAGYAVTSAFTWVFFNQDGALSAARIAPGATSLMSAPQPIADSVEFLHVAGRSSEAAVVVERDYELTWLTVAQDGSVSAPVPIVVEAGTRATSLERHGDGYLLVLRANGRGEFLGMRIAVDGSVVESFSLGFDGNSRPCAQGIDRTLCVYGSVTEMRGGPPRIEALGIPFGNAPGPALLVETVEGETYYADCGCSASGGSAGVLAVIVVVVISTRRRRASEAVQSPTR